MNSAAPRTLLARLRTSARLAMLVLLVFALKIGTAAACAKHDFSDLGLGSDSSHAATMKAPKGMAGIPIRRRPSSDMPILAVTVVAIMPRPWCRIRRL
jgi:hypothetical protein